MSRHLVMLFSLGFVELLASPRPAVGHVSERPIGWELARNQAARNREVTSLFHEPAVLDDHNALRLLPYLDGTRGWTQVQLELGREMTLDQIRSHASRLAAAGLLVG